MKRLLIGIGAVIILILVISGIIFLLRAPATTTPPDNTNPFGGGGTTSTTTSGNTITILTSSGQTVTVPDFTTGHPSFDEQSGRYYEVTQDASGDEVNPDYAILYGTDSTVAVGLLTEPIGKARLEAETKLRALFPGVSDAQLCTLQITVMVPAETNENYAGENLGLSFCPGAVALPN